jgi:galactonate dehydratase
MKITSIKAILSSGGVPEKTRNYIYVKIETDEGIVGWGEATIGPKSIANIVEEYGQVLIGKDPGRIEEHWQTLYHHFQNLRGGPMMMPAIGGIEIALWDIKGKALGVPIYELLGGKMRDRIWCYGRCDGDTPEKAVEVALSFTEQGITALKGDPFNHYGLYVPIEAERLALKKMKAIREAVGDDVEIIIEAHGRLAPDDAIRISNQMAEYRPFAIEEPVPPENLRAMKKVADSISIPIVTGERLYTKWAFTELLHSQIAAMAEAHYVGFQPHNCYGPICTLASLQVDACTPNFMIQEGGITPWFRDAVIGDFPVQKDGFLPLPTGPGLGCDMDEDWLKAHPWKDDALPWSPLYTPVSTPSMQDTTWT